MFERAVLSPAPVRSWAVIVGFAGECALVSSMLMVPLIWPDLLPKAQTLTWILSPGPPPAAVKPQAPAPARPMKPWQMVGGKLYQPATIPPAVATIDDPPAAAETYRAEPGVTNSVPGAIFTALAPIEQPAPMPPPQTAPAPATRVQPGQPTRIRQGGAVQLARLVHRIEPVYPPIARQARISGTVELMGIIGTDGRVRELHVVNGHPLLARAALDAVSQWVYQPTLLNGEPVEVIAPITVIFRLTQ